MAKKSKKAKRMSSKQALHAAYDALKKQCAVSYGAPATTAAVRNLCDMSLTFLTSQSTQIQLNSKVPNKQYITYRIDGAAARPANVDLFVTNVQTYKTLWNTFDQGNLSKPDTLKLLYTAAIAPCLAMELFDKQNKKGPATFFECFIGNMFATKLKREPSQKATLAIGKTNVALTMDLLFPKQGTSKALHVPIKMSTRERVVQAWSHQALLNSAFGANSYSGVMVLFAETKLDSRNLEVVEICVPDQWLAYQTHLAKMDQIYYFDTPARYAQMAAQHPAIFKLNPISDFV